MREKLLCLLLLFFTFLRVESQDFTLADVTVEQEGRTIGLPFAGGLRAPQFSTVDINLDGMEDLVVFDRDGSVFVPLIKQMEGNYQFAPEYRDIFPSVRTWVLFRDFNHDGIKDIFCGAINVGLPGVEVYKGEVVNDQLTYNIVRFPDRDFDLLYFPIGSIVTQVFVSVIDMPDVKDVDLDGDLDILSFDPGGSTIFFYQNLAIEQGFTTDTLIYELSENCYGGMTESGFSQEVTLSPIAGECASFFWLPDELTADARHAGSTILSAEMTGDSLQDILLGDISYDGIVRLKNTGTGQVAHFTEQEVRFPSKSDPISVELFLAAFTANVDDDTAEELLIAPSDRFGSQSQNHIWVYDIQRPQADSIQLTLNTKNFLVDEMIFPGPSSFPAFFDQNGDALVDLMIGTGGRSPDGLEINPKIVLYQNIGTPTQPKFRLQDEDYLGMSSFKTTSLLFAPTLGDIDGDGDTDLVIGDNVGYLYFIENISQSPAFLNFTTPVYQAFDIKVGAHARPFIFDYNKDGMGDLIVGEQNFNSLDGQIGSLNYFENTGTPGLPMFNSDVESAPNNPLFGKVNLKQEGFINNYSAPAIIESEDDLVIASGTDKGNIFIYSTAKETPADSFSIVNNMLGGIREGFRSAISFADIDDDEFYELAVGSSRGGIAIYNTNIKVGLNSSTANVGVEKLISISPNPATDFIEIRIDGRIPETEHFACYNQKGELIHTMISVGGRLDISTLDDGLYFIKFRIDDIDYSSKIVKITP